MIKAEPDKSLNLARLESEMQGFYQEANSIPEWYFRERYIDRCTLDPFYIFEFKADVYEKGDDLFDEELFKTPYPYLSGVCLTREAKDFGGSYWRTIKKDDLLRRLEHFMTMYRGNYLQPPGYKGGHEGPRNIHDRFDKKRFLFKISSPRKGIIGIGPKMFAGVAEIGAICGQVVDENREPLEGATVELISKEVSIKRQTTSDGLFWFSKVPEGKWQIRVSGENCIVQIIKKEEFGNVMGWLSDENGNPIVCASVSFKAPDGEVFNAITSPAGKFTTHAIPAYPILDSPLIEYPYIMKIPDFMFSVRKSVTVSDAALGGTLLDETRKALYNREIILIKDGAKKARTTTNEKGEFWFFELKGGRYQIEVPGCKVYAKEIPGGRLIGKVTGADKPMALELIVKDKVTRTERTSINGGYFFDNLAPGDYAVRLKDINRK